MITLSSKCRWLFIIEHLFRGGYKIFIDHVKTEGSEGYNRTIEARSASGDQGIAPKNFQIEAFLTA